MRTTISCSQANHLTYEKVKKAKISHAISNARLELLPPEILQKIFTFAINDLPSIARLSKKIHKISVDDCFLRKVLKIQSYIAFSNMKDPTYVPAVNTFLKLKNTFPNINFVESRFYAHFVNNHIAFLRSHTPYLEVFNVETKKSQTMTNSNEKITHITFNKKIMVTCSEEGLVKCWHLTNLRCYKEINLGIKKIKCFFIKNGNLYYSLRNNLSIMSLVCDKPLYEMHFTSRIAKIHITSRKLLVATKASTNVVLFIYTLQSYKLDYFSNFTSLATDENLFFCNGIKVVKATINSLSFIDLKILKSNTTKVKKLAIKEIRLVFGHIAIVKTADKNISLYDIKNGLKISNFSLPCDYLLDFCQKTSQLFIESNSEIITLDFSK